MLLEIKNLRAKTNQEEILKGVNFKMDYGQTQALLGPNASGKTTLCQIILGNPKYKVTQGEIIFGGKNITRFPPEKRVKEGIGLVFQSPPAIKGVKLSHLLEKISSTKEDFSSLSILSKWNYLLKREVNLDFSGGERKISELFQILALKPKLIIFDEIDSGLDIQTLKTVSKIIKKEIVKNKASILLITHQGAILKFLKPDTTNVMLDGKIICKDKDYQKVLKTIQKYGYEQCKKCKFLAD